MLEKDGPTLVAEATASLRHTCEMALLENDCYDMLDVLEEGIGIVQEMLASLKEDEYNEPAQLV